MLGSNGLRGVIKHEAMKANTPPVSLANVHLTGIARDLKARADAGRPIRIGVIGSGEMGTDLVTQGALMRGIEIAAIATRRPHTAREAATIAYGDDSHAIEADTQSKVTAAIEAGKMAVTSVETMVTNPLIDVVIDATGKPGVAAAAESAAKQRRAAAKRRTRPVADKGPQISSREYESWLRNPAETCRTFESVSDDQPSTSFFYLAIVGFIGSNLLGPFFWTPFTPVGWSLMIGLCCTGIIGHLALIKAYENLDAVIVQPISYWQLVLGAMIAVTVFGEVLRWNTVVGAVIVVGAGLFTVWREWVVSRRARRAEQADQRIGNDLHQHHASGEDEIGKQEHREQRGLARRDEQQAARHHRQQARHRAAHIAQSLHQPRTRYPHHGIGNEETELHKARLEEAEREEFFQLGDDHIIEGGDPAEDEKQREDEGIEARRIDLRGVCGGFVQRGACRQIGCHCHGLLFSPLVRAL